GWKTLRFSDVGALAWYLKNVPLVFPDFNIETYRPRLAQLHETGVRLSARMPLFWFEARRPENNSDQPR
ncbi:MAG: hypothetical protein ACRD63_07405, partial [Pyrinomonadaceae bacterium]